MVSTLFEKVLLGLLALLMAVGAALGVYAAVQHSKAQTLQIEQLRAEASEARASTEVALQAASALGAALDAKAAAQLSATQAHTATTARLTSAVAAAPAVASTVVPESYWQAIYGGNDAK